ncbi:MAG TPA: FAD-binding oxidoreductase [Chloroflexota bacterium]|nr:FAD-binding oxidoreductase [Chloroflexota bacterium]
MLIRPVDEHKITELRSSFRGRILLPGDSDYDKARTIWNAMIDKHPALIAQCADARDVMTAIAFTRENDLPGSVRGGGHSIAGNALCDNGVVIDLSLMRQVRVDPESQTATAQGGVLWGEFDRATQQHGLATTGGLISTTGIGGFTLGGGMGWLERKYGLTCDNLIAAEVVTADSKLVRASADENRDLFWAIRGGGGNFGVVTEFTYRLHPVGPMVLGGMLIWPFSEADQLYQLYREYTADLTDDLTLMASPLTAPRAPFVPPEMQGKPCVAIIGCFAGSVEDGNRVLAPLRDASPVADMFTEMPYVAVQSMLDPIAPAGIRNYWKSDYLAEITDDFIQVLAEYFRGVPSPMTHVDVHHLEGAYGRVGEDETAFSHRDARYIVNIVSAWTDLADDQRNINWTRDLWNAIRPHSLGATYLNFVTNEGEDRVKASFGELKYHRLAQIKRKYDPTNFFRRNHNIKPAE